MLAVDDFTEGPDRVLHLHVLPLGAGELGGDEERLAQEPLDLPGPTHDDLILLGELIHSEDGDDVLQVLYFWRII